MSIAAHAPVAKVGKLLVTDYAASIKAVIVSELQRLHRQSGSYCQFVGLHEREFRGNDLADIYIRLLGRAPGILVRLGDDVLRSATIARTRYRAAVELEIGVYSNHLGTREERVGGDVVSIDGVSDPGIDQMVADVRALLINHHLLPGLYPILELNRTRGHVDGDEGTVDLLRCTLHADVYPARIPPEGDRPFVDSIQANHTIPTAVPPSATTVSTLSTEADS